jgi:hypothetical protein
MSGHSLKDFDPERVASLDTQMWKAYYAHDFRLLLKLLVTLFKEQFNVNHFTAIRMGYYSMQAARHFRKTGDMERAEHYLRQYYGLLKRYSAEDFDSTKAAKSELHWWIVHRYPTRGSLAQALAENMAVLYSLPPSELMAYANERAEAMELRDVATHKEKREPDWEAIQGHLNKSYAALLRSATRLK